MIDTVRVKYRIEVDRKLLSYYWVSTNTQFPNNKHTTRYTHGFGAIDDPYVKSTYYPVSYDKGPILLVELSLPKVVYGNNIMMLLDIDEGIQYANKLIEKIPALPDIDLAEGVLGRLDVCFNHQVGDLVHYYIQALSKLEYPHRITQPYKDQGVQFYSKARTTKFYDKELESRNVTANGILRQETTLRSAVVKKLLGNKAPTLKNITTEWLISVLEYDLKKLNLLGRSVATYDSALQTLTKEHGEYAGTYYAGLVHSKTQFPKKRLATIAETHPRSLDRKLAKIVDTGLPLTLTDFVKPLPPLSIRKDAEDEDDAVAEIDGELVPEGVK